MTLPTHLVTPDLIRGPAAFNGGAEKAGPRVKPGVTLKEREESTFTDIRHAELVSASISPQGPSACGARWTLKQVQGDDARERL